MLWGESETTMVSTKNKSQITESQANPNAQEMDEDGQRKKISDYEQSREERIKENLEIMQKLGILNLSLKLKSLNPTHKAKSTPSIRRTPQYLSPLPPPGPLRRSSRLQNATPVTFSEFYLTKKDKSLESQDDLRRDVGSKPEVYTEEHEKLLGNTEMSWTLFVDGCGKDGKRIYDPVNGKTCHQCRQKTLGHRTHCCKCNMVQGQFCGDCLYMRYGEHVLEANQNPNWICPVCREICNCSLCRQAKGWPPTGPLYRKISSLGFKSVAHYLVQTRRLKTETEADLTTKVPVSVKRSLPFSHLEATSVEKVFLDHNPRGLENTESEGGIITGHCLDDNLERESNLEFMPKLASSTQCNAENSIPCDNTCDYSKKRVRITEPDVDSIAGRLRQRHDKGKELRSTEAKNGTLNVKGIHNISSPGKAKNFVKLSYSTTPEVAPVTSPKSNKKLLHMVEPSPDSIARRLRQRRSEGKSSGI